MESFVQKQLELLSSGIPEKEATAIEKIYSLNTNNDTEKQLIWALLSRVVQRSSLAIFTSWRVRLTKKVAEISAEEPTMAAGCFVQALLARNPQAGDLHEKTIETLIISLLDKAVANEQLKDLREVAIGLFVTRYGILGAPRLLNTLEIVLADKNLLDVDRSTLILIPQLAKVTYKVQCVLLFFAMLVKTIKTAKPGDSLSMKPLLRVLSLALKKEEYRNGAFETISELAEACKSVFLPIVPRLISTLLTCLDHPSPRLFECLSKLTLIYGASTGLQNNLYNVWSALAQPLHEQIYNEEANALLATIIHKCGYLTKPEVLLHVSREICDSALRYPENTSSHQVVAALLSAQNELTPAPVHIARRLCALNPVSSSSLLLQALADNLARPRIQDIASVHLRALMKNQGAVSTLESLEMQKENLKQVHHQNNSDPTPDLDVNLTEDEMEEDQENPTHLVCSLLVM